jgi:hypothetical protein
MNGSDIKSEDKNRILAEFMGYEVAKGLDKVAQMENSGPPSRNQDALSHLSNELHVVCLWQNNSFVMRLDQYDPLVHVKQLWRLIAKLEKEYFCTTVIQSQLERCGNSPDSTLHKYHFQIKASEMSPMSLNVMVSNQKLKNVAIYEGVYQAIIDIRRQDIRKGFV